jgi:hypothetical protein
MFIKISEPITMFEDNQACIKAVSSWESKRLRHVGIKYNLIKDMAEKNLIKVCYMPTDDQKADFLKNL